MRVPVHVGVGGGAGIDTEKRIQAAAIREHVEKLYNVERLYSAHGYVSPIEFGLGGR